MYTQCVKCDTVFRLSAEVLRAAGGQVRCGRCGEVFNALARLAEDPAAFPAGESAIDLETRANEILESAVPPLKGPGKSPTASDDIIEIEDFDSHDVDFARLQVLEKFVEEPEAKAPQGAPPPGSTAAPTTPPLLSSPPAATKPSASAPARAPARPTASKPKPTPAPKAAKAAPVAPATAPTPATATQADEDSVGDGSMEFTLPPGELDRVFIESTTPNRPSSGGKADPNEVAAAGEASHGTGSPADLDGGIEVSEDVRREMLSGIAEPAFLEISQAPHRSISFNVWMAAAVLLALLFCVQLIHANREWFATHAPLRGSLHGLYAAMGVSVAATANLSAYQLRQWGVTGDPNVTGDPSANGTLRVRASILNTAAQLQPYPLLRVTLANRFGTKIGTRDFEPAEYMGKPVARMLAPGERADATLDIVDPGKDAEGFEIDVCIRGVEQKISCAGDAAAQTKQPGGGS